MTLAELEDMALRCNPTLAQAASRVEAARGNCVQVGLYPNPVAGCIGAEMGNDGRAGQQGGFLSQELVTAKKLQLNRSVASQEVRQAEYAWEMQRQRVVTDVRRSFYDVLVAQRTVELTEQLARLGGGKRGHSTFHEIQNDPFFSGWSSSTIGYKVEPSFRKSAL